MEQRNLLLAIVLSVGILIGFQYLFEKIRPAPPPAPSPATATQTAPSTPAPGSAAPGVAAPGVAAPGVAAPGPTATGAAAAPVAETREAAIAGQKRVRINTPRLHGAITLSGGRIDHLTPAHHHDTGDPKSPQVALLWPPPPKDPPFAPVGIVPA